MFVVLKKTVNIIDNKIRIFIEGNLLFLSVSISKNGTPRSYIRGAERGRQVCGTCVSSLYGTFPIE